VEEGLELSDIRVIASKLDVEELLNDDEEDFDIEEFNGLPTVVVLLLTRAGRVYACLDLDGVGGQWLPTKKVDVLEDSIHEHG
jgi:nucleoporin NUP82